MDDVYEDKGGQIRKCRKVVRIVESYSKIVVVRSKPKNCFEASNFPTQVAGEVISGERDGRLAKPAKAVAEVSRRRKHGRQRLKHRLRRCKILLPCAKPLAVYRSNWPLIPRDEPVCSSG